MLARMASMDKDSRLAWSVALAGTIESCVPRNLFPAFLKAGKGELFMQLRQHAKQADLKFDDYDRIWRILQYLMTHANPNRDPLFLERL